MILEDHRTIGAGLVDLAVLQNDATPAHRREASDDVEQRGLAAARMADDRNVFALLDAERDVLENLGLVRAAGEFLVDVVDQQVVRHDAISVGGGAAGDDVRDRGHHAVEHEADQTDVNQR